MVSRLKFEDLPLWAVCRSGIVESWQLSEKDEWARENHPYRETIEALRLDYWQLINQFEPKKLDTRKWAKICKDAGFKYRLFTTKHHDGFSMFNTMESEFKSAEIKSLKRDILQEVFTAFREAGSPQEPIILKLTGILLYWLDDDTAKGRHASYDTHLHPEIWARYVSFVHRQIAEITSTTEKSIFFG